MRFMEDDSVPVRQTRMVYTVNTAVAEVLTTLARQPRAGALGSGVLAWMGRVQGPQKRLFRVAMGSPASWDDVILQGPHLYVATPMYKAPNPTMKNKLDWSATDLRALAPRRYSCHRIQAGRKPSYDTTLTTRNGSLAQPELNTGSLGEPWRLTLVSGH